MIDAVSPVLWPSGTQIYTLSALPCARSEPVVSESCSVSRLLRIYMPEDGILDYLFLDSMEFWLGGVW